MRVFLPVLRNYPPPPTPAEVLYVAPTGTGEGRLCRNCVLWDAPDARCTIHGAQLPVNATMVCGYHVFGRPLDGWIDFPGIEIVVPATSGLVQVSEPGTACGNCAAFRPGLPAGSTAGACMRVGEVVTGGWRPAQVDAYGCCARWVPRDTT